MTIHRGSLPPWDGVAPVALLDRVRRFNRSILNPVVRQLAGRMPGPLILLRHRGRVSGRAYSTPVIAQKTASGFVIPLTYGERADWVKNVLAAGGALIRRHWSTYLVSEPVILDDRAALRFFSPALRLAIRLVRMKRFMQVNISPHKQRFEP